MQKVHSYQKHALRHAKISVAYRTTDSGYRFHQISSYSFIFPSRYSPLSLNAAYLVLEDGSPSFLTSLLSSYLITHLLISTGLSPSLE